MNEYRNPFKLRTAEHIDASSEFLRLFSPTVLDILSKDEIWNRIQIFLSAPGGGKTSLLKLFTPTSLLTVYDGRKNDDYIDLYKDLKKLEIISEVDGPLVLGIMLSCIKSYSSLEELEYTSNRKEGLFFSLLNARLIITALRNAIILKRLHYPDDLERIEIRVSQTQDLPPRIPIPCNGKILHDWARTTESRVLEAIDSFGPIGQDNLEAHDALYAFSILNPENIYCDGTQVANRVLIMLDDVHKLAPNQRLKLTNTLSEIRPNIGVWIAERLEALQPNDLLFRGATTGREYTNPINLEFFWRDNAKKFETAVTNIADRRVGLAKDIKSKTFRNFLLESLDSKDLKEKYKNALEVVKNRVIEKIGSSQKYDDWLSYKENLDVNLRDKLIAWRSLEILVDRESKNEQLSFDFGLTIEELNRKETSQVHGAAELLISQEFNIPYYFGMRNLSLLSSSNIDQFLALAGEEFEEVVSSVLIKKVTTISPERQIAILRKSVESRWEEIPRKVLYGRDVQKLLQAIQQFCRFEWDKGRASYGGGGGITGIALSYDDLDKLLDENNYQFRPEYKRLLLTISSCLSNNLLEAQPDTKQGPKGTSWLVLYLNRWMCLHFDLPLQYGGFRHKSIVDLIKWLNQGFKPSKNEVGFL